MASLLLQVGLGIIALVLVNVLLVSKRRNRGKNGALELPEAAGRWPIIGHLLALGGKQPLMRTLGALADKYGAAFVLWVGVHRTLVVSSAEFARECFTTHDKILASRPRSTAGKHLGSDYAMFGLSPYGPYWREVRKVVVSNLLSAQQVDLLKHVRSTEIDFCIKELHKLWLKNGKALVAVEMKQYFKDLTLNNLARAICGKRYFGSDVVEDGKDVQKFHEAISGLFYLGGIFVLSDAVPSLERLDIGGHVAAMKKNIKELDSIISVWLEEHRQSRLSGEKPANPDFIDVLLSVIETTQIPDYDPEIMMKTTSWALILAGSDTTFITLTWALSLLMNNRHVLKKAQEELDSIVGKDRNVDGSDIKNLPYLQAIVKEILRLYPSVPLSVPHQAIEDCIIGGYHVPAGTRILTNLWKIQRDPRHWPEPDEFRPERFITTHKHVDMKGKHFEFIPFGSGRRMCPGASFALEVIHLTLARFLHGFHMETRDGAPVDLTEDLGLSLPKATPVEVLVAPRLPSNLYL
ncbi:cytochrome P450 CYP82D47-like [Aristolochia californica]|uniref:cytochrome P450 CYP82D47-like n=1 Tax=Aristolochia californica TaxID=171875 RepID=UPI0035DB694F